MSLESCSNYGNAKFVVGPRLRRLLQRGCILSQPEIDALMQQNVWRCISWKRSYGHWEVLFDDQVIESHFQEFIAEIASRGAEKFTSSLVGKLSDAMNASTPEPMKGAQSLKSVMHNRRLEEFTCAT